MSEHTSTYKKPPPKWFIRFFTRINVWVYRLSGGRLMHKFAGREICLVKMKGARSGKAIFIPLMYVPYKQGVLLVASQGGAPHHPGWYFNILANPNIEVQVGNQRLNVIARQAASTEKESIWPICLEYYPPYADYQKVTHRDIPVFVCLPS